VERQSLPETVCIWPACYLQPSFHLPLASISYDLIFRPESDVPQSQISGPDVIIPFLTGTLQPNLSVVSLIDDRNPLLNFIDSVSFNDSHSRPSSVSGSWWRNNLISVCQPKMLLEIGGGVRIPLVSVAPQVYAVDESCGIQIAVENINHCQSFTHESVPYQVSNPPTRTFRQSQNSFLAPDADVRARLEGMPSTIASSSPPKKESPELSESYLKISLTGDKAARPPPPSRVIPDPDRKVYCTHWVRTGECDYTQQGCKYKHEMPDKRVLEVIGIRRTPPWWIEESLRQRRVAPYSDKLDRIRRAASETSLDEHRVGDDGRGNQPIRPSPSSQMKLNYPLNTPRKYVASPTSGPRGSPVEFDSAPQQSTFLATRMPTPKSSPLSLPSDDFPVLPPQAKPEFRRFFLGKQQEGPELVQRRLSPPASFRSQPAGKLTKGLGSSKFAVDKPAAEPVRSRKAAHVPHRAHHKRPATKLFIKGQGKMSSPRVQSLT
jgi:hypothetical protein